MFISIVFPFFSSYIALFLFVTYVKEYRNSYKSPENDLSENIIAINDCSLVLPSVRGVFIKS